MSNTADWRFETKQIHSGAAARPGDARLAPRPIYQTTSYVFDNTEHAANLFALAEFGNIYTRIQNPTQAVVEERLAALEGGTGALLVASRPGRRDVRGAQHRRRPATTSSRRRSIYGGTYNLFKYTLAEARHRDAPSSRTRTTPTSGARAVRPNTKLFFAETIGNPKINVLDIRTVSPMSRTRPASRSSSTTRSPTPYLIRPFEHGADIVLHSATKFLGGHGTVDRRRHRRRRHASSGPKNVEKFPGLTVPDPSYHGASYTAAVGDGLAYIIKARVQLLRDLGAAISPQQRVAADPGHRDALAAHRASRAERAGDRGVAREPPRRRVGQLLGPADLEPWYAAANRYAPKGVGAVLSFELKGGVDGRPRRSSTPRRCSATSRTSATCARSSSTPHRRRTRS